MNDKFLSMYFNNEQIELIQKASLEKAIVNNILPPDEHYPKELVNFFEEWEQKGEKIEGNKLVIDDTDKWLYYKGYDPGNARGCIRQEAEAYINRILSVMPILHQADVVKERLDFTISEHREIDKAVEYFNENYLAADIFKNINDSMACSNPDMNAEDRIERGIDILRTAEEEYYNQPIDERTLIQEIHEEMRATMTDFKEMMAAINKITEKGKAAIQKVLHNEKAEKNNKSR